MHKRRWNKYWHHSSHLSTIFLYPLVGKVRVQVRKAKGNQHLNVGSQCPIKWQHYTIKQRRLGHQGPTPSSKLFVLHSILCYPNIWCSFEYVSIATKWGGGVHVVKKIINPEPRLGKNQTNKNPKTSDCTDSLSFPQREKKKESVRGRGRKRVRAVSATIEKGIFWVTNKQSEGVTQTTARTSRGLKFRNPGRRFLFH